MDTWLWNDIRILEEKNNGHTTSVQPTTTQQIPLPIPDRLRGSYKLCSNQGSIFQLEPSILHIKGPSQTKNALLEDIESSSSIGDRVVKAMKVFPHILCNSSNKPTLEISISSTRLVPTLDEVVHQIIVIQILFQRKESA